MSISKSTEYGNINISLDAVASLAGGVVTECYGVVGFVLRGGEYDLERGARALIDDFRKGRIGKITLESAADYSGFFA